MRRRIRTLAIASLTLDAAKALYRANNWLPIAGDELPGPIAFTTFDLRRVFTITSQALAA